MSVVPEVTRMADEATPALAFEEWVAGRGRALQRFAYLVTGSPEDAADLVQDALSRAWPRWNELAGRGTVEAYLRRSVVNGSISRWRKDRRLVITDDVDAVSAVVPDGTAPLADADAAWSLCADLPPAQRAAVVLRFYEDLSYAEIADVLGCPESTARSHVHRALARLRLVLGEQSEEDLR